WELDADVGALRAAAPLTPAGKAAWQGLLETYRATTDQDEFMGGVDDDTIIVTDTTQIQATDELDGGGGSDTLPVGGKGPGQGLSIDFRGGVTLQTINNSTFVINSLRKLENLEFVVPFSSATFSSLQFGLGLLANNLHVTGSGAGTITIDLAPAASTFSMQQ